MPFVLIEGNITFTFPNTLQVFRPENLSYYTRHFQNFAGGCKEMDFLAYEAAKKTLWLIEVKDYRTNPRTKPLDLFDEIAIKARDCLAFLLSAAVNDNAPGNSAKSLMTTCGIPEKIRVALHLEVPSKPSRLCPGVKREADALQKLKQKLRPIDPHPVLCSTKSFNLPWGSV